MSCPGLRSTRSTKEPLNAALDLFSPGLQGLIGSVFRGPVLPSLWVQQLIDSAGILPPISGFQTTAACTFWTSCLFLEESPYLAKETPSEELHIGSDPDPSLEPVYPRECCQVNRTFQELLAVFPFEYALSVCIMYHSQTRLRSYLVPRLPQSIQKP